MVRRISAGNKLDVIFSPVQHEHVLRLPVLGDASLVDIIHGLFVQPTRQKEFFAASEESGGWLGACDTVEKFVVTPRTLVIFLRRTLAGLRLSRARVSFPLHLDTAAYMTSDACGGRHFAETP